MNGDELNKRIRGAIAREPEEQEPAQDPTIPVLVNGVWTKPRPAVRSVDGGAGTSGKRTARRAPSMNDIIRRAARGDDR